MYTWFVVSTIPSLLRKTIKLHKPIKHWLENHRKTKFTMYEYNLESENILKTKSNVSLLFWSCVTCHFFSIVIWCFFKEFKMGSAGQILILSYGGLKEKVFLIYRSRHVQGCQDPSFLENSGQINGIMASHCHIDYHGQFSFFFWWRHSMGSFPSEGIHQG